MWASKALKKRRVYIYVCECDYICRDQLWVRGGRRDKRHTIKKELNNN